MIIGEILKQTHQLRKRVFLKFLQFLQQTANLISSLIFISLKLNMKKKLTQLCWYLSLGLSEQS